MDFSGMKTPDNKPDPEDLKGILKGIMFYQSSTDDPDDTLFLSLTQREVAFLGTALMLFKVTAGGAEFLIPMLETLNKLCNKIAEAMTVQKDLPPMEDE